MTAKERRWQTYIIVGFLCFITVSADAADPTEIELFQGRYSAMKTAMASRDGTAIAAGLAADFVSVDVSGHSITADEMIAELVKIPIDTGKTSKTDLLTVTVNGDVAHIDQKYHMHTTKLSSDGQKHVVDLVAQSSDTWVQVNGVWLLQRTETDQVDYSVDGHVIKHQQRNAEP